MLFNRGYGTDAEARAFLKAQSISNTDPFQLIGMQNAVERIQQALDQNEPIAIYGDYDVDGVTSTALLVQAFEGLGANVREYIPNRFDEGYGLNTDALDSLKEDGVKLVITVDCGIRSPDEALHAQTIGLDLIISDHHHPDGLNLPPAFAVINPKQHGDPYPDKDLAGVGIAYKIAEALIGVQQKPVNSFQLSDLLDLVALGTVADLAPLVGENRVLVRRGLQTDPRNQATGIILTRRCGKYKNRKDHLGQHWFHVGSASQRFRQTRICIGILRTANNNRLHACRSTCTAARYAK